jgi:glycosyltransferase involved in cell wall biosynthesis
VGRALVLVRNDVSHDARVLREARLLRDLGYDVLVAGVVSQKERTTELDFDGIPLVRLLGPRRLALRFLPRRGDSTDEGADPIEGLSAGTSGGSRIRRLLVTVAFNVQGIALVWRISPELVHANDYDTMWIGVAAKLLRGSGVVYDAHELWAEQDGDAGWRPWLLACEWLFVRLADATVTVSPGCARAMATRYRVSEPAVVRNVPERVLNASELKSGQDGRPVAVYVGVLAPGRGLEQAVRALAAVPNLQLRLIGPDADGFSSTIVREAEAAGVADRVEVLPPVPPGAVLDTIAGTRMGLVLIQPTSLSHRLSLPNKLFEYLAAGLPVLASDLPVIGPLVRDEELGEVVPPADVEAIAQAMRRLVDSDQNAALRLRVRSFAEHSTWEHERCRLEAVYRDAFARRRATAAS